MAATPKPRFLRLPDVDGSTFAEGDVPQYVDGKMVGVSQVGSSPHTHAQAEVDGLVAALAAKAALAHTHGMGEITGLVAELAAKADDAHSHIIADVTGLQAALDALTDPAELAAAITAAVNAHAGTDASDAELLAAIASEVANRDTAIAAAVADLTADIAAAAAAAAAEVEIERKRIDQLFRERDALGLASDGYGVSHLYSGAALVSGSLIVLHAPEVPVRIKGLSIINLAGAVPQHDANRIRCEPTRSSYEYGTNAIINTPLAQKTNRQTDAGTDTSRPGEAMVQWKPWRFNAVPWLADPVIMPGEMISCFWYVTATAPSLTILHHNVYLEHLRDG